MSQCPWDVTSFEAIVRLGLTISEERNPDVHVFHTSHVSRVSAFSLQQQEASCIRLLLVAIALPLKHLDRFEQLCC